jgi:hypothetical protein
MCVLIFSKNFVTFLILREILRDMTINANRIYLATADLYLLAQLKSQMNGRRFYNARDIIENAMDELKRSQNRFQEPFQLLYCRWQKYVVVRGKYFDGNVP